METLHRLGLSSIVEFIIIYRFSQLVIHEAHTIYL
jgi:hypothetical protein